MTNYNDGKIHGWNGGDMPVHPKSVVQVWLYLGGTHKDEAGEFYWTHSTAGYIVAFKVLKEYKEAKTVWVNEFEDFILSYGTEEVAKRLAGPSAIRVAVKYKEVIEEDEV